MNIEESYGANLVAAEGDIIGLVGWPVIAVSAPASCYAETGYRPETWVTLYSQDIGYSRLARSTCRRLNPTLDTISWILFARKS